MATSLNIAKAKKFDEYYTLTKDIEQEINHYSPYLKNKVIYCCCDDPRYSNFYRFFCSNFERLQLKKVIASCSKSELGCALYSEYSGGEYLYNDKMKFRRMRSNGDFRSQESSDFMEEADIIVTNPPFSTIRTFLYMLIKREKKFIIIANRNTITCKRIFPYFLKDKFHLGYGFNKGTAHFIIPPTLIGYYSHTTKKNPNQVPFRNVVWITNLPVNKEYKPLNLSHTYADCKYEKYDQYDAINVDKIQNIPVDYEGKMGVPITFLDKCDPSLYDIIGIDRYVKGNPNGRRFTINGKEKYARLIIQKKNIIKI